MITVTPRASGLAPYLLFGKKSNHVNNVDELLALHWIQVNTQDDGFDHWEYDKPPGATPEESAQYEEQGVARGSGGLLIARYDNGDPWVVAHLQFPTWEEAHAFVHESGLIPFTPN